MDGFRFARHWPIGIEVAVEMATGFDPADHLDAADFDYAVAAARKSRGLRVEDNFAHGFLKHPSAGRDNTGYCALGSGFLPACRKCRRQSRRGCRFSSSGGAFAGTVDLAVSLSSAPTRAITLSRCSSVAAETTTLVERCIAAGLEQQGYVEQERRSSPMLDDEPGSLMMDGGWTIASAPRQLIAVDNTAADNVSIDHPFTGSSGSAPR